MKIFPGKRRFPPSLPHDALLRRFFRGLGRVTDGLDPPRPRAIRLRFPWPSSGKAGGFSAHFFCRVRASKPCPPSRKGFFGQPSSAQGKGVVSNRLPLRFAPRGNEPDLSLSPLLPPLDLSQS